MASSSTSSIHKINFKYDVFLSFRGEDTRTNFVDHFYQALKRENIETYKDDENLERGKKISQELINAIEESRFHVIVFSENYASSSWCLEELVKIMECQNMMTVHSVYPIFYHVEPTQVRKQTGEFGKAFASHEMDEAVKKWRKALVEATSFSGRELMTTANGQEAEFIKRVVKDISLRLPSINALDDNLVGMRTRIYDVVSSLKTFSDEFCMLGIWGMGGIGKTTLARAVFDYISNRFEGSSFVENVRESSILGLSSLQQQVIRDVLNRQDIIVSGVFDEKTMMKKYMSQRMVLVVLDDVDNIDQLKALAGEPNWFMKGSKIIITTRDKQVLLAHKVVNSIHEVNPLTNEEAVSLLSRCAFGKESPIQGYEKLSQQVVSYAVGLPLTITTLGATLCDENEHVWRDTLKELEEIPLDGTLQRLELSYKGLDSNCKEIFLDVVCIMKGWTEDEAIKVLESCGFPARRGLSVLEKRSLITISHDKYLGMHDRIEEMGRHVVRHLHPHDPNQHSRLWIKKEIMDILENNQGTKSTKCIKLISTLSSDIKPKTIMKGLGNMGKLRFLLVRSFDFSRPELDETSHFPNSLQYLEWYRYPFRFLPRSFQASNLVVLKMSNTHIEQLWEGGERKVLHKLRFLQFVAPKLRTLDLGLTPNLEMLDLERCYDLKDLDTLVWCRKLKTIKLSGLKVSKLDLLLTPNIDTLNLDECVDLVELVFPRKCPQLKTVSLKGCHGLVELYMPWECPQLISVLAEYSNFVKLHMPWEWPQLQTLNLEGSNGLEKLYMPMEFPQLITVNLKGCSRLKKLNMPRECPQLITLDVGYGYALTELHIPHKCPQLETLFLTECDKLETFDMPREYPQLKSARIGGQNLRLLTNPDDLVLPKLQHLRLAHSKSRTFGLALNLKSLTLASCDLEELHIPDGDVKLKDLYINSCLNLKTLDLT